MSSNTELVNSSKIGTFVTVSTIDAIYGQVFARGLIVDVIESFNTYYCKVFLPVNCQVEIHEWMLQPEEIIG